MTAERDEHGHALEWKPMTIHIERMHLEEDAGKNVHEGLAGCRQVFLHRSEPRGHAAWRDRDGAGFSHVWQAYDYVNHVRRVLQWVGASDADMEKGNLRCEANVSVRKIGETRFRNKVELKNLNSVRFMQKAIEFEIERQIKAHETGEPVNQETRLWDEKNKQTRVMRSKEDATITGIFPSRTCSRCGNGRIYRSVKRRNAGVAGCDARPIYRGFMSWHSPTLRNWSLSIDLAEYFETTAKARRNPKLSANWILGGTDCGIEQCGQIRRRQPG